MCFTIMISPSCRTMNTRLVSPGGAVIAVTPVGTEANGTKWMLEGSGAGMKMPPPPGSLLHEPTPRSRKPAMSGWSQGR